MLQSFAPVLLQLILAIGFAVLIMVISTVVGPKKLNPIKNDAYECGVDYFADARGIFHVRFYLVAVLFVLFDVEAIFILPWAATFLHFKKAGLGLFIFLEMVVFMGVLVAGYIYILKKGALKWE